MSVEDAKKIGVEYIEKKLPLSQNGKTVALGEPIRGICKVLIDKSSQIILGVHLISPSASEIISTATLLVQLKVMTEQLEDCIFPHPTISEIIKETIKS